MNLRGKVTVKYRNLAYQWVDATNGILQINITRGIPNYEGMWSQCQPGQLRLRSRNTNLDPAKNNQINTFTIIRVEVEGTPIFTGKIFDTNTEYFPKEDSIVTINAFDELGVLSQRKIVNRKCINQTYERKEIIAPINFGDFIQFGNRGFGGSLQNYQPHIIEGYERTTKDYSSRYSSISGNLKHTWYSNDQTKYPTPNGSQYYSYTLGSLPANHRTDSIWQLPDWDGVVVSNPTSSSFYAPPDAQLFYANGWGTQQRWSDGTTHCKPTYVMKDGINYLGAYGSSSGIYDPFHPLHNQTGYWTGNWGSTNRTFAPIDNWAALFTTNDNNAYELWLKCEQSEAGFGYVDAYNRFRHFSRAIIDRDNFAQPVKLSFNSDGSSTSYNSIRVTNGTENIVKGVTVNNLWSSEIVEYWKIDAWRDENIDDINYVKSTDKNRDGTSNPPQQFKLLQPSQTTAPIKKYEWLPYSSYEVRDSYENLARTNTSVLSNPIFNTYQRDWDVSKLSTRSYFAGITGVNGSNQLTLNTNYAWNMGHEYGGFQRMANGNYLEYNATNYTYGRPDNVLDRQKELAQMVLESYSNPITDIRSISFSVHNDDINSIKGVDIFDAINITHNEAGLSIDKNYAVMGITHTITPDNWDVTYQLWNRQGRP